MQYYSAIKINEIMPFAAPWVDLGIIILNEVSQTEKSKYNTISLICGIFFFEGPNKLIYKPEKD